MIPAAARVPMLAAVDDGLERLEDVLFPSGFFFVHQHSRGYRWDIINILLLLLAPVFFLGSRATRAGP